MICQKLEPPTDEFFVAEIWKLQLDNYSTISIHLCVNRPAILRLFAQ